MWELFTCGGDIHMCELLMCGGDIHVWELLTCGGDIHMWELLICGGNIHVWELLTCGGDIHVWELLTCGTSHQSEILHSLIFFFFCILFIITRGKQEITNRLVSPLLLFLYFLYFSYCKQQVRPLSCQKVHLKMFRINDVRCQKQKKTYNLNSRFPDPSCS